MLYHNVQINETFQVNYVKQITFLIPKGKRLLVINREKEENRE